jgi:lysozyme
MTAVVFPSRANIFAAAEPIIKEFEGFRAKPYICPAGKATIGFGTTRYPNGAPVTMRDPKCTEAQATVYLEYSMGRVLDSLQKGSAIQRSPTVNQAAALLSLAYNVGVGIHDGKKGDLADSTLLARFNAGLIDDAADQFLVWDKARVNGIMVSLPGLRTRRKWERALFLKPDDALVT